MNASGLITALDEVISKAPTKVEAARELNGLVNGLEHLIQSAEKRLDKDRGTDGESIARSLLLDLCTRKAQAEDKISEIYAALQS